MNIEVEHIIDDTAKEIYLFKAPAYPPFIFEYAGISFVFRDGRGDVWGDEWSNHHSKDKNAELNKRCLELTGEDYGEISPWDHERFSSEFSKIEQKYNPCALTTKHGKRRYSGAYFGSNSEKPTPKMSIEEIKIAILEQLSRMQVKLGI